MRSVSCRTSARGHRGAALSLAAVWLWAGSACSDRPLGASDAGAPFDPADSGDAPASAYYTPCEPGTIVGGAFVVLLSPGAMAPGAGDVGYTYVSAGVTDGVARSDQWITSAAEGTCRLLDRPPCASACAEPTFCARGNRCASTPPRKDVGTISLHGLGVPLELTPLQGAYSWTITDPFPAFSPGTPITIETSGGDYAPFFLEARGVEALAFDGANLSFGRGRSLDFTWTPPTRPSAARILAIVTLQPSALGPVIECTLPDTGAASVPASLLDPLLALGINGTPHLYVSRRTVTSTNIAPGCVQLEVTATVKRNVAVDGVMLCDNDWRCPEPLTCHENFTCG
jgi:hypothetical protein